MSQSIASCVARPTVTLAFATLLIAALGPRPVEAIPQPPHDFEGNGIECLDCHIPYASLNDPGEGEGSATAGSDVVSLSDANQIWIDDEWIGGVVTILSGANRGQFRPVASNTTTALTWVEPLPAPLAVGDTYQVGKTTHEDIETRCKSCHNPTGQASSKPNVGLHVVRAGTVVGCGKCHDPHNIEPNSGMGQGLIRQEVRWETANTPTQFPGTHPDNRFISDGVDLNGICETCHTDTLHHRNNPSGNHDHQVTTPCTSCHAHEKGFKVECTECHAEPQDNGDGQPVGGRRAIVGEFPVGDAHAHYGAELGSFDCQLCHDTSAHQSGLVRLIDADDGSIYEFSEWTDLSDDPDVSTFCSSCHDEDGARRLSAPFDPFANGNSPPDVKARFQGTLRWEERYGDVCFGTEGTLRKVNSHHDISTDDQGWSGAKVECLNCHGAHNASSAQALIDPFNPTTPWQDVENGFCLQCHNGGAGPDDAGLPAGVIPPTIPLRGLDTCGYTMEPFWVRYTWTNEAHGPDSKRDWPGYSGADAGEMNCTDCHDPHGSVTVANPVGNPYMIRDLVDGRIYVDDGVRPSGFNGPPFDVFGVEREVVVAIDDLSVSWGAQDGLCSACHVDWLQAYSWHDLCGGCQTCHGHGQAFGGRDYGTGSSNATPCP